MFDMITWISQHKFEKISTMKTPTTISGKNQINWNWRGVHFEGVYLYLLKKIPLMHVKIGKYLKFTTNNQMPYIINHNLNIWSPLFKKGIYIYFIFNTVSLPMHPSQQHFDFENFKPFSEILPCHISIFRSNITLF